MAFMVNLPLAEGTAMYATGRLSAERRLHRLMIQKGGSRRKGNFRRRFQDGMPPSSEGVKVRATALSS